MKIDLHVHTSFSDASYSPVEAVRAAARAGLAGIAIADHNDIRGYFVAKRAAKDLIIVPAIEVSTADGHILAYGILENLPRDRSAEETVEIISEMGGLAAVPHPYRFWSGTGEAVAVRLAGRLHAIETVNSMCKEGNNIRARALAKKLGLAGIGGSDAHRLENIGRAYTRFDDNPGSADDIIALIMRGNCVPGGQGRPARSTVEYVARSVSNWIKRGMKRI